MSVSILVVDDEPDVVDLFRQRFRREVRSGTYVMHFANSGEDALQQLGNGIEPQLIVILSDINMPEMDGLALLARIKQRFPEIPVMMVTAYGDDERDAVPATSVPANFSPSQWTLTHSKRNCSDWQTEPIEASPPSIVRSRGVIRQRRVRAGPGR